MWNLIEYAYDIVYFILKNAESLKWEVLLFYVVYLFGKRSGMKMFRKFLQGHFHYFADENEEWRKWATKQIVFLGGAEWQPTKLYLLTKRSKRVAVTSSNTLLNLSPEDINQEGNKMKTVMLDAGHGDHDPGAIGTSRRKEKDFNLYVVLKVQELLHNNPNLKVILTRSTDVFLELKERTTLANKAKVDAFISFHANSYVATSTGTETHYTSSKSKGLAEVMQKAQLQATGLKDRGLKTGKLYVTKNTKMPSCLLEPGYVSNPLEDALLFEPLFMDKYAECIARGICEYFGVAYEVVPEAPVIPLTPKGTTYVPAILGERIFDGFISEGKSWIPAKEVLTFLSPIWTFKGKSIIVNGTELETKIFNSTAYIKATDLKALDLLRNVMLDPDAVDTKRVLLYSKESVLNG